MSVLLDITYANSKTLFYLNSSFNLLKDLVAVEKTFIITDENIYPFYEETLKSWKVILIPAGESSKSLQTVEYVIGELLRMEADRDAIIVGVGGGVVTDLSGFVAGIYKRGVRCAFLPTSILAMVDAAIGGKNGLDLGNFKNMIGLIRQPEFLLYDYDFLDTLPRDEWINGFAEIIKHASILDGEMFRFLENNTLSTIQKNQDALAQLIQNNVAIKVRVVQEDELEQGNRKILNFGHTFGHAIEALYNLPHGKAIAIGMNKAAELSSLLNGFEENDRLAQLLDQYELPITIDYDEQMVMAFLLQDKKRNEEELNYILLNKIGEAIIKPLNLKKLKTLI